MITAIVITLVVLAFAPVIFVRNRDRIMSKFRPQHEQEEMSLPFLIIPVKSQDEQVTPQADPTSAVANKLPSKPLNKPLYDLDTRVRRTVVQRKSPNEVRRWVAPAAAAGFVMSATLVFALVVRRTTSKSSEGPVNPRALPTRVVAPPAAPARDTVAFQGDTEQSLGLLDTMGIDLSQQYFATAAGTLPPSGELDIAGVMHEPTMVDAGPSHAVATVPLVSRAVTVAPIKAMTGEKRRSVIVPGMTHTCLLSPAGEAHCWGGNSQGQLGMLGGATTIGKEPNVRFTSLSAGLSSTCALTADGDAYCWGGNERGQLGDGTTASRATPVRVAGGYTWTSVAIGASHACGVSSSARILCWGDGRLGQVGRGDHESVNRPVLVIAKGIAFASVVAGWYHTCALTPEGVAYCWGENGSGALGDGTTIDRSVPVPVRTDHRFVALAGGYAHTCGVTTSGAILCWGLNNYGQLGNGVLENRDTKRKVIRARLTPTQIHSFESFIGIAAGDVHTCALSRDNTVWCWGRNVYGQLGDESTIDRYSPVKVSGEHRFATLAAFGKHTCGTTVADELLCWGYNRDGQLGDGTRKDQLRPLYAMRNGDSGRTTPR